MNKVTWAVLAALATVRASYAADDNAAPATSPSSLDQITVTAQRSSENMQDVPITIQAFTGDTLQQLNVSTFDDLVKYTPNVTFATNGPGQGNIYIRGLSAGFAGNQSSATIAPFPNVALYLDDQSMQFPARNLDVYMVDMQRIEILEGPQGTLFGGGAEAGAVRYITNKPELNVTGGNVEANYSLTSHGDPNTAANATFNLPLIDDTLALRTVIYSDHRGGYIDNVPSTFTRGNNDLGSFYTGIKPVNGLCPNGLPTSTGNCAVPNSPVGNNNDVARNNWNPTTYNGIRASALYKINDDWNILLSQTFQNMEADGESVEYPIGSDGQKLSALQVTAFTPAFDKDHFSNTAWTVNGKFGDLNAVYTGGYTNRHVDQQQDYTNYSRSVGGWYYGCTGGSGLGAGKTPVCYSPVSSWRDQTQNKHLSNEFRLSTPDDWRLHAIGGLFLENFKIYDNMNFNYKTIPSCTPDNLAVALAGGAPCLANVATAPGSTASDPGERGDLTAFGEDAQRGYKQEALFGSVGYDIIQDILQLNVGTRYYHYSEYETGSQYSTGTNCLNVPNGQCNPGAKNIDAEGLRTTYHGFKSRANIVWHLTPDTMFYYTFSQGFRPGAFNRTVSAVAPGPDGPQFEKPHGYAPDSLTNNEIGWKSELFDNRLQLNGSLYHMNWNNVQLLFFNPEALGNTTFGVNGPNYAINGLELQFIGHVTDGLSIQGSSSWNHSRQKNSPCLVGNIPGVPAYGQCITQVVESGLGLQPFQNPFGAVGTVPAFAPSSEFNIRARYDWSFGNSKAFAMVGASHVGSMYNQPATYLSGDSETIPTTTLLRYEQPAYTTYDASIGMSRDNWTAALYGTNLSDSHASVFTSSAQFIKSEVPLRPRVIGLKFNYKF